MDPNCKSIPDPQELPEPSIWPYHGLDIHGGKASRKTPGRPASCHIDPECGLTCQYTNPANNLPA